MNKEQIRQYFMVFILSLAVAGVFSLYLFYRRGYYDLFVLNNIFQIIDSKYIFVRNRSI